MTAERETIQVKSSKKRAFKEQDATALKYTV